jgi:hypothetical protein
MCTTPKSPPLRPSPPTLHLVIRSSSILETGTRSECQDPSCLLHVVCVRVTVRSDSTVQLANETGLNDHSVRKKGKVT